VRGCRRGEKKGGKIHRNKKKQAARHGMKGKEGRDNADGDLFLMLFLPFPSLIARPRVRKATGEKTKLI
jgi:hypothetical protein